MIEHRQERRGDWSRITDSLDPTTTPLAEILRQVFGHFETVVEGRNDWSLVMVEFRNQHRSEPATQERLRAIYRIWHAEIARFVVALQAGRWVSHRRDPKLVATQLFAATEGMRALAAVYHPDSSCRRGSRPFCFRDRGGPVLK